MTLASGDSYTYELGAKFVSSGKYYITVADANLTVLGYIQINVVAGNHEFALNSTRVLGTTEKETYDGQDYTVIYNDDKATVALNITNNNDVSYESTLRYVLYSKDKDAAEWDEGTTKSTSNLSIPVNSTSTQLFNILSLNKDKLYKVVVLKSSNTALSTSTEDKNPITQPAPNFTRYTKAFFFASRFPVSKSFSEPIKLS